MASERQRTAPGLLGDLHSAQAQFASPLTPEALTALSQKWRLPAGEIAASASFYHFLAAPPARHHLYFVDHVVDAHAGVAALVAQFAERTALAPGQVSRDGAYAVGWTSCAGLSDQPPAALVDGRPLPRLSQARINAIAELVRAGIPPCDWPSEWFTVTNDVHRQGPLIEWASSASSEAILSSPRACEPEAILAEVEAAGLRGRGGAGFPTATKWRYCRQAAGERRYLICNADEGEPGTFKDRYLLTCHPHRLFDGMTLAARAIGAESAILYLRAEYAYLLPQLEKALAERRAAGLLESPSWPLSISIALGAGAYVCGEESALIESLEGKPGRPRVRPPFPVTHGYLGQPTVVNNVETLVAVAAIVAKGAKWWHAQGTAQSSGPKLFCVSGDVARPGIYEFPYGVSLGEVIEAAQPVGTAALAQVSGPSGTLLPVDSTTAARRLAFEDLPCNGTIMLFSTERDPVAIVAHFARFFAHESCGFCTPCRVGTQLIARTFAKIEKGLATQFDLERLAPALEAMRLASNCGFGLSAGNPVRDLIAHFRPQLEARLLPHDFVPAFSLDAELAATRQLTHRDDPHAHLAQFEQPEV